MSVGSSRRIVAALAAVAAFALQPGTTGRAALDDSSNPGCPGATALPAVTGKVLKLTGSLQCFRPGGTSFGGNVQVPPNQQIREEAPKEGDPCRDIRYYPVTFSEDASPSGDPTAHFPILGDATNGQLPVPQALSGDDANMIGANDAIVADTKLGSYELTNPNDPNSALQCVLDPTFHFYCPTTGAVGTLCLVWLGHPFTAAPPAPATVAPFFSNVLGSIQASAGTIQSMPATKGVVNTPVCFWIQGISIPQEQDLTLVLPGPIDASGRQIFFTYFARIQFQGVTWNFDDPASNDAAAAPQQCDNGQNQLGVQNLFVAHQYAQISDGRNGDDTYHVTATEQYSISVVVYWWDSDGAHGPQAVDPGVAAPTLTAGPYPQFVGQVEGVPIGGQ